MKTTISYLTSQQKKFFNRDGFLVIKDFIKADECELLIQRAKKLITDFAPADF
jgi:hypothetical protein